MCIRDRLDADLRDEGIEETWNAFVALARGIDPDRAIGPDPVSYTHLRAHETVLDLVCRLLLEKKKNHNTATSADDMRTSKCAEYSMSVKLP